MQPTLGDIRREYLDIANKARAERAYNVVEEYIKNFETTIKEDSTVDKEMKKDFDISEQERIENFNKKMVELKNQPEETYAELYNYWKDYYKVIAIEQRLYICWQTALKNGLFND